MVFYLIGLGLGDVRDITVKGLETIRRCNKIYLEAYTSILSYGFSKIELEKFYERTIIEADRNFVEESSEEMLNESKNIDIALLVVGDPFGATTHADLVLRAKKKDVEIHIIHNTSIINAVGCCGLQLYNFGMTISIVIWLNDWQPDSYYDKILINRKNGLHTLCLLDIKTKEQSILNIMRCKKIFEPPNYMTCDEAANQLLTILDRKKNSLTNNELSTQNQEHIFAYSKDTYVVGLARIGWNDQKILYCSLEEMANTDLGPPLHSLIIPGNLHPIEESMLNTFKK